jgi:Enterobacteriaceae phage serine recombinase
MTIYGYMRVSQDDQTHDLQRDALEQYGCEAIFADTISGKSTSRKELDRLLETLAWGDTLVVWKLDRLGRKTVHLYTLIEELQRRGVSFVSITQNFNTSTSMGKAMFGMLCVFAEMERELISERTRAGLDATRARGTVLGRPRMIDSEMEEEILALQHLSTRRIARTLGVNHTTVYRVLARYRDQAGCDLI